MHKVHPIITVVIYSFFLLLAGISISYLEKGVKKPENMKLTQVTPTAKPPKVVRTAVKVIPMTPTPTPFECGAAVGALETQTVNIELTDNGYNPKTVNVSVNKRVVMNVKVKEGYHNLVIDGFKVRTPYVTTGKVISTSFVVCQPGQFKFYSDTSQYENLTLEGVLSVQ